ncbi:DUF4259 domain-containing protein [Deinococcus sonorensis]|uniref:DUF4259 domain-containing protein n=2 Tax=Deinococcus sonorensis TaxID=309891 RepID=A0AAU7UA56_9DEIO
MNVWGTGAFDNDSAAAYASEVVSDGLPALQEAFEVVLDPDTDFIEAEEGARAVAAAQILQVHLSGDTAPLTDAALRSWLAEQPAGSLAGLHEVAAEALERVLGPQSELPDLWEEAEDGQAWRGTVEGLRAGL